MALFVPFHDFDTSFPAEHCVVCSDLFQFTQGKKQFFIQIELHVCEDSDQRCRVFVHQGQCETDTGTKEVCVFTSIDDALQCYQQKHEACLQDGYTPVVGLCATTGIGTTRARNDPTSLDPALKSLLQELVTEAHNHLFSQLLPNGAVTLAAIDAAEAVLMRIDTEISASPPNTAAVNALWKQFLASFPAKPIAAIDNPSLFPEAVLNYRQLTQLCRDMLGVDEVIDLNASADTQYRALQCHVACLHGDDYDQVKALALESIDDVSRRELITIGAIYSLHHTSEQQRFTYDIPDRRLLFHGSKFQYFLGIISRGLLMPAASVASGMTRTDIGYLGAGIYFSDDMLASVKYTSPSRSGRRLMAVSEVALGSQFEVCQHRTDLVEPPPGFNSVHAMKRASAMPSAFADDEFVVYSVKQQRLRYLVEFVANDDPVPPLPLTAISAKAVDSPVRVPRLPCTDLTLRPYTEAQVVFSPADGKQEVGLITDDGAVPLQSVHVRACVVDMVADVVVLQQYYNASDSAMEAKYVFPLGDGGAAVYGFEAYIRDRHVVGKVKEKAVAQREYKEAVAAGHGAYLMDQVDDRPDIFTVSLGNLPPHTRAVIKLTYVLELAMEGPAVCLVLPALLSPTDAVAGTKAPTQFTTRTSAVAAGAVPASVLVSVRSARSIVSVQCPSHDVRVKRSDTMAVVQLKEHADGSPAVLDRDFVLLVESALAHEPRMFVEVDESVGTCAAMVAFYPEFDTPSTSPEIILVVDRSASMQGQPFQDAVAMLRLTLAHLPPNATFNVIGFGSCEARLFPASVPVSDATVRQALRYADRLAPDFGGTLLADTLIHLCVLQAKRRTLSNVLVFTDGAIASPSHLLSVLLAHTAHLRVFTVGVGPSPQRHTIQALARAGAGKAEFVDNFTNSTDARKRNITMKIIRQLQRAKQPSLSNVHIQWHTRDVAAVQSPRTLPSVFSGERQICYAVTDYCNRAELIATCGGEEVSNSVYTPDVAFLKGNLIHRLAARAAIHDYEQGSYGSDAASHAVAKELSKDRLIQLSLRYGLVTQWTSIVAVEERDGITVGDSQCPTAVDIAKELQEGFDCLPVADWDDSDDGTALRTRAREGIASGNYVAALRHLQELTRLPTAWSPSDHTLLLQCAEEAIGHVSSGSGDKDVSKELTSHQVDSALSSIVDSVSTAILPHCRSNHDTVAWMCVRTQLRQLKSKLLQSTESSDWPEVAKLAQQLLPPFDSLRLSTVLSCARTLQATDPREAVELAVAEVATVDAPQPGTNNDASGPPAPSGSTVGVPGMWKCVQCLFVNAESMSQSKCGVCGVSRPLTTPDTALETLNSLRKLVTTLQRFAKLKPRPLPKRVPGSDAPSGVAAEDDDVIRQAFEVLTSKQNLNLASLVEGNSENLLRIALQSVGRQPFATAVGSLLSRLRKSAVAGVVPYHRFHQCMQDFIEQSEAAITETPSRLRIVHGQEPQRHRRRRAVLPAVADHSHRRSKTKALTMANVSAITDEDFNRAVDVELVSHSDSVPSLSDLLPSEDVVILEHRDTKGRKMGTKESFRQLSYPFHGKKKSNGKKNGRAVLDEDTHARQQDVLEIESQMESLSELYQDLSTVVQDQGEQIGGEALHARSLPKGGKVGKRGVEEPANTANKGEEHAPRRRTAGENKRSSDLFLARREEDRRRKEEEALRAQQRARARASEQEEERLARCGGVAEEERRKAEAEAARLACVREEERRLEEAAAASAAAAGEVAAAEAELETFTRRVDQFRSGKRAAADHVSQLLVDKETTTASAATAAAVNSNNNNNNSSSSNSSVRWADQWAEDDGLDLFGDRIDPLGATIRAPSQQQPRAPPASTGAHIAGRPTAAAPVARGPTAGGPSAGGPGTASSYAAPAARKPLFEEDESDDEMGFSLFDGDALSSCASSSGGGVAVSGAVDVSSCDVGRSGCVGGLFEIDDDMEGGNDMGPADLFDAPSQPFASVRPAPVRARKAAPPPKPGVSDSKPKKKAMMASSNGGKQKPVGQERFRTISSRNESIQLGGRAKMATIDLCHAVPKKKGFLGPMGNADKAFCALLFLVAIGVVLLVVYLLFYVATSFVLPLFFAAVPDDLPPGAIPSDVSPGGVHDPTGVADVASGVVHSVVVPSGDLSVAADVSTDGVPSVVHSVVPSGDVSPDGVDVELSAVLSDNLSGVADVSQVSGHIEDESMSREASPDTPREGTRGGMSMSSPSHSHTHPEVSSLSAGADAPSFLSSIGSALAGIGDAFNSAGESIVTVSGAVFDDLFSAYSLFCVVALVGRLCS